MGHRSNRRLIGTVVAAAGLTAFMSAAQAAPPQEGALVQLPGTSHCYTASSNFGACTQWAELGLPMSIAITPDGRFEYIASGDPGGGNGEILLARRDPGTGALSPVVGTAGCYSNDGSGPAGPGTCTVAAGAGSGDGAGLTTSYELDGLGISSDGRYLYAVSPKLNAIVSFAIEPATGALTELPLAQNGCLTGAATAGCAPATGLLSPDSLTLSPDGTALYASSYDQNELTIFHRDPTTGALSQLSGTAGCVSDSGTSGACTADAELSKPGPVVVSADGTTVHVAAYAGKAVLTYAVGSGGALSRPAGAAGCLQDPSGPGGCSQQLTPLYGAYGLARSPDGNELYVGLYDDSGITALSTPAGSAPSLIGCTEETSATPPCADGTGLTLIGDLAAAGDGVAVYGAAGDTGLCSTCGVVAFSRDHATGALAQFAAGGGCQLTAPPTSGPEMSCATDPVAVDPYSITTSPDSNFVYAGGINNSVTPNTGWLTAYSAVAAPSCKGASATVVAGQSVTVPLACTDFDGNPLTLSVSRAPAHGAVSAIDQFHQTVTYTASAGYSGADSVSYGATDGTNSSAPASVQITVTPAGSPTTTTSTITTSTTTTSTTQTTPAPKLSRLRVSPRTVAITGRLVRHRCMPASGANTRDQQCTRLIALAVSYELNVAARVTVRIDLVLAGRIVGHGCAAPTPANKRHPQCVRLSAVPGTLSYRGVAGANSFTFTGRIGNRPLTPGSYDLFATATASRRNSVAQSASFQITH